MAAQNIIPSGQIAAFERARKLLRRQPQPQPQTQLPQHLTPVPPHPHQQIPLQLQSPINEGAQLQAFDRQAEIEKQLRTQQPQAPVKPMEKPTEQPQTSSPTEPQRPPPPARVLTQAEKFFETYRVQFFPFGARDYILHNTDLLLHAYLQFKKNPFEFESIPSSISVVNKKVFADVGVTRNKLIYHPGSASTEDMWTEIASYDDVHVVVVPIDVKRDDLNPLDRTKVLEHNKELRRVAESQKTAIPPSPAYLFWQETSVETSNGLSVARLGTVPKHTWSGDPDIVRYDFRLTNVKQKWEKPLFVFACKLVVPADSDKPEVQARDIQKRREVLCDCIHVVNSSLSALQKNRMTSFKTLFITGSSLHIAEEFSIVMTCIEKLYRRQDPHQFVPLEFLFDMLTSPGLLLSTVPDLATHEELLPAFDTRMFTEVNEIINLTEMTRFNQWNVDLPPIETASQTSQRTGEAETSTTPIPAPAPVPQ